MAADPKALAQKIGKVSPAEVLMRAVHMGQHALDSGDAEQSLKILKSAHEMCQKQEAPPPVHGLCLRVYGQALMAVGHYEESRELLKLGVSMNEAALKNPNLPDFFRQDVQARLGDLYASLGEVERLGNNFKESLRALRKAVGFFEKLGAAEFQVAAVNRIGLVLIQKGEYKNALEELADAAEKAKTAESENATNLLATNYRHEADAHKGLGDVEAHKAALERSLAAAREAGSAGLVEEITVQLATEDDRDPGEDVLPGQDVYV